MWEFNVVVTQANGGRLRYLLEELSDYGEFHKTEFLGVVLGAVEDREAFLEAISKRRVAFADLGRVVPVEKVFVFRVEDFLGKVCEAVGPWVAGIAGSRFHVRLERRGHKGQIVSPEAERAIDAFIEDELAKVGKTAKVDFENPDFIVVVETFGDRCGVGLLTREVMELHDFVRVG